MITVGLPQGLLYYQYGHMWERFFKELGMLVVKSGETTRTTLDCGSALDEVCLPAKVYFGHAQALRAKADCLFVPRVVSVQREQYMCPKIIGMPDLLRSNIRGIPPIIDVDINLRTTTRSLYQAVVSIGKALGRNALHSIYAWYRAWQQQGGQTIIGDALLTGGPRVALIGHPYIIYDRQVSMNGIAKLRELGVQVITPEMVTPQSAAAAARSLGKAIFWSNSRHIAGAALALMAGRQPVNGILFMTCFSCGPDALIGELIHQQALVRGIPCMNLSIDEHTAEAGVITRLEAFTDMLKWRWRTC